MDRRSTNTETSCEIGKRADRKRIGCVSSIDLDRTGRIGDRGGLKSGWIRSQLRQPIAGYSSSPRMLCYHAR